MIKHYGMSDLKVEKIEGGIAKIVGVISSPRIMRIKASIPEDKIKNYTPGELKERSKKGYEFWEIEDEIVKVVLAGETLLNKLI